MGISFCLVSGLVLTLFDEARAVEMRFSDDAPKLLSDAGVFELDIILPAGERVPIESITAIVEKQAPGADSKKGAILVTRATCSFTGNPNSGCVAAQLTTEADQPAAITTIAFRGYFDKSGATVTTSEAFGYGAILGTTTGYGYDSIGGYGYGYSTGSKVAFNGGYGYGYGTPGADLVLRFQITVVSHVLDVGRHYLTATATTGSDIIGILSSPYVEFSVVRAESGTGGGSSPTSPPSSSTPAPPSTRPNIKADVRPVQAPEGAKAKFQATAPRVEVGQKFVMTVPDAVVGSIEFIPSETLQDATIDVVIFTPESPPPALAAAPVPSTLRVASFVEVTITSGGTTHSITVAVQIQAADAGDPDKAILVKWDPVAAVWIPQQRVSLTLADGVFTGSGQATCCSLFGVLFDETAPTVSVTLPTATVKESYTFVAQAADDLGVQVVEFYVDGQLLSSDSSAPYTWTFDLRDKPNGVYDLRVVAIDYVENANSTSGSFEVFNGPVPAADDDALPPLVSLAGNLFFILVGVLVLGYVGYWAYDKYKARK